MSATDDEIISQHSMLKEFELPLLVYRFSRQDISKDDLYQVFDTFCRGDYPGDLDEIPGGASSSSLSFYQDDQYCYIEAEMEGGYFSDLTEAETAKSVILNGCIVVGCSYRGKPYCSQHSKTETLTEEHLQELVVNANKLRIETACKELDWAMANLQDPFSDPQIIKTIYPKSVTVDAFFGEDGEKCEVILTLVEEVPPELKDEQ